MSLPTNFKGFENLIYKYLSQKIPVDEILCFIDSHPVELESYLSEFDEAIALYNQFRQDAEFQNRELLVNSLELAAKFDQELPEFSSITPTEEVFALLGKDDYFEEVWTIRPVDLLLINLLLLIYRTTILLENKDNLIDSSGRQKVQISSTIEEMVFLIHNSGRQSILYPAFRIWYLQGATDGFDTRLFHNTTI